MSYASVLLLQRSVLCERIFPISGEVIEGDSVIVAVPLGCLKAGAIAFSPPLPDWKRAAISTLGNGNLNKARTAARSFPSFDPTAPCADPATEPWATA